MKLKEQKRLGMLYFVLGAVLAIAGYFIKSSWLASFGGGVCVLELVRLLRAARLIRDPDQAADYDASLQDERTAYVANKARSLTFFICIYAQLLAVLAAILVFHQPLIGKVLCALTCIQSLIYTGCYWYYNRKYWRGVPAWNLHSRIQIGELYLAHVRQYRQLVEIVADGFLLPQDFLESVQNHNLFSETTGGHIIALAHMGLCCFLAYRVQILF